MEGFQLAADKLRGAPVVSKHLYTLREEMLCMARDAGHSTLVKAWTEYGLSNDQYVPLSLAKILQPPLIDAAIAIGWHLTPHDVERPPNNYPDPKRGLMGHLVHEAKRYDDRPKYVGHGQIEELAKLSICALAPTQFSRKIDLIVSMPSSRNTNTLPFSIVEHVGSLTDVPVGPMEAIQFCTRVRSVKDIMEYWAKRDALHMSMRADSSILAGKSVLIVDDICKFGATFIEAARACKAADASNVFVLALSKTYACQRIPERSKIVDDGYPGNMGKVAF